jgi:GH25 family lysozyme M1 (1,4-beta-N-acetylmuramidase)
VVAPLFVDAYAGDLGGRPDWRHLVELGAPWHGAMIKATEGIHYSPIWFQQNWRALRDAGGDRYGHDWFRWAYHFLRFAVGGAAQADYFLRAVDEAGGWAIGDGWPVVDVELGSAGDPAKGIPRNKNWDASAQQIIDVTSQFAESVKRRTGRPVVLYGNGAMRDKGIKDRMGCDYFWPARYTATLPKEISERAGWSIDRLLCWQYSGDADVAQLHGYPDRPPGFAGDVDVSALVIDGGLDYLRSHLWAERPAS